MPTATVNNHEGVDIQLKYYLDGPENGEVVCFIMGLGGQSIHYSYNSFVAPLVSQGYRVLRFDNRDSGKSTILTDFPPTNLVWRNFKALITGVPGQTIVNPQRPVTTQHIMVNLEDCDYTIQPGQRPRNMDIVTDGFKAPIPCRPRPSSFTNFVGLARKLPVYDLADMACDVLLLLDHLKIQKVHLVGVSMGGMISQLIAGLQPSRILSLSLVMTSTSHPKLQASTRFLYHTFVSRKAPGPNDPIEKWIDFSIETNKLIGRNTDAKTLNNGFTAEQYVRQYFRRAGRAEGIERQIEAIDTEICRDMVVDYLAPRISTLVFHGKQDQLVPTTNGLHIFEVMKQSIERSINPALVHIPPQRRGSRRFSLSRNRRGSTSRSRSRSRRASVSRSPSPGRASTGRGRSLSTSSDAGSLTRKQSAEPESVKDEKDEPPQPLLTPKTTTTMTTTTTTTQAGVAPTITTTRRRSVTTLEPPEGSIHPAVSPDGVPLRIEELFEVLDGRLEVRTIIPPVNPHLNQNTVDPHATPVRGKQVSLTLCLLEDAAHELCDDYCKFLVPQLLLHFDRSMGRRDVRLNERPPEPLWGDLDDVLYGTTDYEDNNDDDEDDEDDTNTAQHQHTIDVTTTVTIEQTTTQRDSTNTQHVIAQSGPHEVTMERLTSNSLPAGVDQQQSDGTGSNHVEEIEENEETVAVTVVATSSTHISSIELDNNVSQPATTTDELDAPDQSQAQDKPLIVDSSTAPVVDDPENPPESTVVTTTINPITESGDLENQQIAKVEGKSVEVEVVDTLTIEATPE